MDKIPIAVRHSYTGKKNMPTNTAHKCLSSHIKYIEHRSRRTETESRDDRRIFSDHSDVINRKDALNDIEAHAGPGPRAAYYHKIMISPRQDVPVNDYRAWTRAIMHDLEQKQGKHLHWYAVQHKNTENYHVHIVIAGAGENLETGELEAVIIRPADYDFIKEKGLEYSEFAHQQFIRETLAEIDRRDDTIMSQELAKKEVER